MENKRNLEFGEIKIGKTGIFVSDPCYTKYNGANIHLIAKDGIYKTFAEKAEIPFWGDRVVSISIVHTDYIDKIESMCKEYIDDIGVDSGTAGIFDNHYYSKYHTINDINEEWHNKYICTELDDIAIFDKKSIVSSAGIGDGSYGVYGVYDENNKIVALTIEYLNDDYFDDEEDE